jgi:hypothetical protein
MGFNWRTNDKAGTGLRLSLNDKDNPKIKKREMVIAAISRFIFR